MTQFLTVTGAAALVKSVVDLIRYLVAGYKSAALTQGAVWVAGVGTVFLMKASDVASTVRLGESLTLATANAATAVLAGLGLGSGAMLINDFKKAIDNTDTAVKPPLVAPPKE